MNSLYGRLGKNDIITTNIIVNKQNYVKFESVILNKIFKVKPLPLSNNYPVF
jgi:hypothetical protein